MNERLKELFTHAFPPSLNDSNLVQLSAEKFAELIVKQCGYYADVFESLGCPVDMDPTDTKPSDYIKLQFGVE